MLLIHQGNLAETIPYCEKDVPSYGYFGRQGEQNHHLDDVEYGKAFFLDTDITIRFMFL